MNVSYWSRPFFGHKIKLGMNVTQFFKSDLTDWYHSISRPTQSIFLKLCMLLDHHYEKNWHDRILGNMFTIPKWIIFGIAFPVLRISSTDFSSGFSRLISRWGIIIQILAWSLNHASYKGIKDAPNLCVAMFVKKLILEKNGTH